MWSSGSSLGLQVTNHTEPQFSHLQMRGNSDVARLNFHTEAIVSQTPVICAPVFLIFATPTRYLDSVFSYKSTDFFKT